jgi:hypothetical protein
VPITLASDIWRRAAKLSKEWFVPALREAEMKIQQEVGAITWLEETNPEQNFAGSPCLWAISGKIFTGPPEAIPSHRDHHFIRGSFNPSTSLITATHRHPGEFMTLDDGRNSFVYLSDAISDPLGFRVTRMFQGYEELYRQELVGSGGLKQVRDCAKEICAAILLPTAAT